MKIIQIKDCLTCENLIQDKMMDDYICKLEPQAMTEFVGKTLSEIECSEKIRRCLKTNYKTERSNELTNDKR